MALELQGVSLRVGAEEHIYPVDLALAEGDFNILLGTTLSGKTSMMRLMAGLEKPTTGEILFNGQRVTGQSVQQREVAMVYQQFINYPNFTVFQNIASPLKLRGMSRSEIEASVGKVAELLKLTPMLHRLPSELSGGQQQRTALARALVKEAKLVLLDEPLANLDYKLREELREELPKLFRDTGATVVYATTEPAEALLLGGQTATLHEGRVTQFGPTSEVYRYPQSVRTAKVFSDPPINIAPVKKTADMLALDQSTQWPVSSAQSALPDGDYTLAIRPHHLTLQADVEQAVPIAGKVLLTELTGSESTVHARIGESTWISQSHGIHTLEPGNAVQLYLNPQQCFLFDPAGQLVASSMTGTEI
ncbi:MAG: ABC transporter ATP-binding protein [Gammaproteobacteria bacterium]|nr:ABC transporter ATP-binding protein [Gammaproteobacteria bacterium]